MNVWFTSDLHIGHLKVAQLRAHTLGPVLPRVVGAEATWHDRMLARNWDAVVKPEDVVWVLGDISSGTDKAQRNALEWIKERPGLKHLISGNHDSCHPMHRDSHKWQRVYLEAFESVQMAAKRRIPLPEGHTGVLLSHFPYKADHTDESRYPEWRLNNRGFTLLHGHTHSSLRLSYDSGFPGLGIVTSQIHVGVDAWDFKPVNLTEIHKLIVAATS